MALARLITRTPEYAQQLAHSLAGAGYTVEFVSPEEISAQPAELEVNLDDPSAASAYIVTADGREISFVYDPVEREFVLAPLWRKLRATALLLMERFPRKAPQPDGERATAPEITPPIAEPEMQSAPSVTAEALQPETALADEPVVLEEPVIALEAPAAPSMQSLYLPATPASEPERPEPVHFSGMEYFDGLGERRSKATSEPAAVEPQAQPTPPRFDLLMKQAAAWVEQVRNEVSNHWQAQHQRFARSFHGLKEHDRAWMRAVPVAALIALAFLLGWAVANSGQTETQAAQPSMPDMSEATVVPMPQLEQEVKTKATTTKPAKKAVVKRSADEEEEAEDVVIRHYPKHYPSKGVQAADQKNIRKYSDLED